MNEVRLCDVTMRQNGSNADYSLSFKEKLEVAKLLDRIGVDVIELEGIHQTKVDSLRIKSAASAVKDSVLAVPVELNKESVHTVWNALKEARYPRLQVPSPVSAVQMEYLYHMKPAALVNAIQDTITECRLLTDNVEFIAEDATRSDPEFLYSVISAAVQAGAKTITVCDTAGSLLPDELADFLDALYLHVPLLSSITLGISCIDTLAMADACAIAAIKHGVREIKAAAYPLNTISLQNICRLLSVKGDAFGVNIHMQTTSLRSSLERIAWMCETGRNQTSPFDNGVRDDSQNLSLTVHDDRGVVQQAAQQLGYDLSDEDLDRVWDEFRKIAEKKETVSSRELDAVIAAVAMQVPPTYRLESYTIHTSNLVTAMAHMKLNKNGRSIDGVSLGDGPIDAAFLAIEQIVGHHFELDDFQIQAITEGREALGETVVRLRCNGALYSGRGTSTDIIGSGIAAYLNAVNKIVYEEVEA